VKIEIGLIRARLRAPFVSAHGGIGARDLLVLRLRAADGAVGAGEAAPLHSYDGVSVDDVRAALEDCRELLEQGDVTPRADLLAACRDLAVLPQALAAIDLALWDLEGRRAGLPVWKLLGAASAGPVDVNATLVATDRAGAAAQAAAALTAGFRCVKLKVGVGDDAARIAAVRAAGGPELAIRLDANGAWSVEEAVAALRVLEPAGIECCEEPVHGLEGVREVSDATSVPIAIDESAALPGALDERACDAVCLKVSRCGGITGVLGAAARARAAGYDVYLASTLDGPLGIAAALHAAALLEPQRPCGLATLALFEGRQAVLAPVAGKVAVPRGAGLGDGLTSWYD
jgi:L-Ala-D/L-Glu epimerase